MIRLSAVLLLPFAFFGCADELARAVEELYIVDNPIAVPAPGNYGADVDVVLTSSTGGAQIWYTVDGSEPRPGAGTSVLYSGAINVNPVNSPYRIFARAFRDGMTPSQEVIAPFNVEYVGPSAPLSVTAAPVTDAVYDGVSGTWSGPIRILVTGDSSNDAGNRWNDDGFTPRIHYTIDSTIPDGGSPSVANGGGLEIAQVSDDGDDVTINAITIVGGAYPNSPAATLRVRIRFTDRVAEPVFTDPSDAPLPEVCYGATDVKIASSTPGAQVAVEIQTNGGSWNPISSGASPRTVTIFSSPANGDVVNLRAVASGDADQGDSELVSASFVYIQGSIQKPSVSPATGTYGGSPLLDISSDFPGATIYYTTDGTYPDVAVENLYTTSFALAPGVYYINAIAEYQGVESAVSSAVITVTS